MFRNDFFFKKPTLYENTHNVTSAIYHRKNKILVSKCSERKNKILVSKCSERNVLTNNAQISKTFDVSLFLKLRRLCTTDEWPEKQDFGIKMFRKDSLLFSRSRLFMNIPTMWQALYLLAPGNVDCKHQWMICGRKDRQRDKQT